MPLVATIVGPGNDNQSVDLTISAGEDVATQLKITLDGVPYDISGLGARMQINFPIPLPLTTGNRGIVFDDPSGGALMIVMGGTLTETLPVGSFPYDLFIFNGDGSNAIQVIAGLFNVLQSIAGIP